MGASPAGSTSPACPASRPAEIMEQRLSHGHPGLLPRAAVELSACAGCPEGLQRREGWRGTGMWLGAGGWSLSLLMGQQWQTQRHPAKPAWVVLRGGFPAQVGQCWELAVLVEELLRGSQ